MSSGINIRKDILYRFFLRLQLFSLGLLILNLIFSLKIHSKEQIIFDILFLVISSITVSMVLIWRQTSKAITFCAYSFALTHPLSCYYMEAQDTVPFIWSPVIFFVILFIAREKHQKLAPWIYLGGVFTAFLLIQLQNKNIIHTDKLDSLDLIFNLLLQIAILAYINRCNNWYHYKVLEKEKNENLENIKLIGVLCHDVANPLGNIKSLSSEDFVDSVDKKELLNLISFSADAALGIVDKVRAQRSLKDGKYQVNTEVVNLMEIIQASLKILDYKIKSKNIQVNIDVPSELNIKTDPIILANNIVNNILTNAIKFSDPNSSIDINASIEAKNLVKLTIADKGMGIPKELMSDLFDIDKATSRPGTAGEAGTGYGMVLIKDSIEKLGGKLYIDSKTKEESKEEHGTRISLTLAV